MWTQHGRRAAAGSCAARDSQASRMTSARSRLQPCRSTARGPAVGTGHALTACAWCARQVRGARASDRDGSQTL